MTIIYNQSDIAYHANPAIGSTTAKLWLDSPRLFKDQIDGIRKRKDTRSFMFGRAAHARFTDREFFDRIVSTGPVNPKTGKPYGADTNAYAEWSAANPGAIILSESEMNDLDYMDERMPAQVREIFADTNGVAESSVYQTIAGVAVKCRPDWIGRGPIYDIKTIANIADAEKHISKFKYWFSHAWYRMVMKAETGASMPFKFVFAEKCPPYRWRIVSIDADWIGQADATVDRVLGEIAVAQDSGDYSDRGEVEEIASQPTWESDDDGEEE